MLFDKKHKLMPYEKWVEEYNKEEVKEQRKKLAHN